MKPKIVSSKVLVTLIWNVFWAGHDIMVVKSLLKLFTPSKINVYSKICGRQPLKKINFVKGCLQQILLEPF